MPSPERFSLNPAGLSRPWELTEEVIVEAATLSKACEDVPYGQHILHILASLPGRSYSLEQLTLELTATASDTQKSINQINKFCDAYGRAPIVENTDGNYRMDEVVAKVLMAAWEAWS